MNKSLNKAEIKALGIKIESIQFFYWAIYSEDGKETWPKSYEAPKPKIFRRLTSVYFDVIISFNKEVKTRKVERFLTKKLQLPRVPKDDSGADILLGGETYCRYNFTKEDGRHHEFEGKDKVIMDMTCFRGRGNFHLRPTLFRKEYKHILNYQKHLEKEIKKIFS